MNPQDVDVNAHPTKIEVRFRDKKSVFSAVHRACKQALTSIEHGFRPQGLGYIAEEATGVDTASSPSSRTAPLFEASRGDRVGEMRSALQGGRPVAESVPRGPRRCSDGPLPSPSSVRRFVQMHDSYILVEDEEGVSFLDQHALHERKLFEELMERAERGDTEVQRLLIPAVLEASIAEIETLMAHQDELASIGFEIAPFGEDSVAVYAVPVDLAHMDPQRLMDSVLCIDDEQISTGFADIRRSLLAGIACRAAVKFNDPLTDEAIRSLLDWEDRNPAAAACPHGRPIRLRVPLHELERRFQRKE
jgi:DNA mismatch repair protein MutL